ncbi:sensor histidine kinase [Nocardioides xinjiangensis]|uniref:sensor histidine kinase n=1 Tax=Nocardioides xinjiangensis TaxID=2817376 RepID=UPI001B30189F|nr:MULTISPECIES: HAMP domain-containing sensor histidine kinase [unclassified Nocardioides]
MRQDDGTWVRPRAQAWGNEAQRAVLHALAEDIARRSEHRVAAIQVLRSDGHLEFAAITGDPDVRARLLGQAAPLALEPMTAFGSPVEGWIHIPGERLDDDARAWLAEYGHTPDLPAPDRQDGWRPDDRLVRLLRNDAGELRATLYLDEPLSGLRPTRASVAAINAEAHVLFDAIVGVVERELYAQEVRMLAQVRTALHSVRPGLPLQDFVAEVSGAMVAALDVHSVDLVVAGGTVPDLEPSTAAALEAHVRDAWADRRHFVVERTQTWGAAEAAVATPPALRALMEGRGLESLLLVPIGMGEDYLGTLALGRTRAQSRWIDSEVNAATTVASDMAGVLLGSRLMDRERRLNAELRSVSDYRRDMVLTLAHELRNPVSVLWMHLEMLGEVVGFRPVQESLAAMDRATRRIEDMVEDLMALASVSDTGHDSPSDVDLSALVREGGEFLAPTARASGVAFELRVADDLRVVGEPAGLQRMVSNLLSNAFKYTPAGGRVTMEAGSRAVGGRDGVSITCADTGIGIGSSELGQVFSPFFRSRDAEARKRPGTGLGLAIVERVVARHGGTVEVQSVLGEGTTLTVWLPLAPPDDVP